MGRIDMNECANFVGAVRCCDKRFAQLTCELGKTANIVRGHFGLHSRILNWKGRPPIGCQFVNRSESKWRANIAWLNRGWALKSLGRRPCSGERRVPFRFAQCEVSFKGQLSPKKERV